MARHPQCFRREADQVKCDVQLITPSNVVACASTPAIRTENYRGTSCDIEADCHGDCRRIAIPNPCETSNYRSLDTGNSVELRSFEEKI